jgi:N-acetylglutamate synthase-like GNAT family acetyltransferase
VVHVERAVSCDADGFAALASARLRTMCGQTILLERLAGERGGAARIGRFDDAELCVSCARAWPGDPVDLFEHDRPNNGLTVRVATPNDLDAIVRVRRTVAARTYADFATPAELKVWLDHRQHARTIWAELADDLTTVFVAECDGDVVGTGGVRLVDGGAELFGLYVTLTGLGAGSMLMAERLRVAVEAGAERVRCWTFAENSGALAFLVRHGFEVVERDVRAVPPLSYTTLLRLERAAKH